MMGTSPESELMWCAFFFGDAGGAGVGFRQPTFASFPFTGPGPSEDGGRPSVPPLRFSHRRSLMKMLPSPATPLNVVRKLEGVRESGGGCVVPGWALLFDEAAEPEPEPEPDAVDVEVRPGGDLVDIRVTQESWQRWWWSRARRSVYAQLDARQGLTHLERRNLLRFRSLYRTDSPGTYYGQPRDGRLTFAFFSCSDLERS